MHGFVNLLFATAVARRDPSVTTGTLSAILDESSPAAFAIDDAGLGWKDIRLSRDDLVTARGTPYLEKKDAELALGDKSDEGSRSGMAEGREPPAEVARRHGGPDRGFWRAFGPVPEERVR